VTATASEPALALKSPQGRGVLAATILGSGVASLDATVVNVALPRIGTDLHAGLTALQWTLNAYTLTLSGLLLLGGSLGDRMGRRRIFVFGVIWFTAASAGCALAPGAGVLIAMRALQGVGAALLTPGSLAILEAVFRRDDRAAAVGAWSGLGGVATAIGPVVGGLLVGVAPWGWRLVFLLNLPLAAAVVVLSIRYIPETRDEQAQGPLDVPGTVLAASGLALVVYGLTEGPRTGWTVASTVCLAVGALLVVAFVVWEGRSRSAMLPLSLFRSRNFSAANLVTLVVYFALSGAFFLLPLQLQRVAGFAPVAAGSALLPVTAVMLVLSARMGRLAQRIGPRWPMTVGPLIAGVGLAMFAGIGADASYVVDVLPGALVYALGLSCTVAPLTATVLAAAPLRQVGVASAVNNDVARAAGLLAVAVLPSLAGITPRAYARPAEFSTGFHHAIWICAALCALGGLLSALFIGRAMRPVDAARGADPAALQPHCAVTAPHARPAVTAGCRGEVSAGPGRQPVGEGDPPEPGAVPG
jgi:EmrB/QacA subfamily drug resistance transporter